MSVEKLRCERSSIQGIIAGESPGHSCGGSRSCCWSGRVHPALPQIELLERGKGSQGSKVARRLALLKWRRSSPMWHGNMNCRGRVIHASFVQVLVVRLYGPVAGNGNHVRHLLRSNLRGFVSSCKTSCHSDCSNRLSSTSVVEIAAALAGSLAPD